MTFPRDARPHEIAILEKLLLGWEPKAVKRFFHYTTHSTVYRVKTKYIHVLVKAGVCR